MKKTTATSTLALLLALTIGVAVVPFAVNPALAAQQVSAKMGKPLKEAQSLIAAHDYKGALSKVDEADAMGGKSSYEGYIIASLRGQIYANLKDYGNAAKAMEAALASGQAPASQTNAILKQILAFYAQTNNTAKITEYGNRYLKDVGADSDIQMSLAQSYLAQRNYKQAEEMVRSAIKTAESKGGAAKEDQLATLRFIAHEQGNAAGEQAALEQLVQRFPSARYWEDMLTNASRTIKSPTASLDILRLKYLTGGMKGADDYMNLAQEAMVQQVPNEAKKVAEAGMQKKVLGEGPQKDRHVRLVEMTKRQVVDDQAGLAARDAEAKASATGDLDVKLGQSYWSYGQNDKAIEAIQRGLKKGVKDKDDALLRLGIVQITAGKKALAQDTFRGIKAGTPSAQVARLWVLYAATH